ncbi:hypothetical protein FDB42_01800 [Clostridium botulinum]|uniref:hypothetical protein n=1 Tax=Clostridium botulinum TaxID=1491 RepID=UPI0013FE5BA1|nr:hypothetical protein [Clostridium botulinum]MBY6914838.1 hypothetical protein [Clostridium botulinum]NFO38854.1 hypothetical protein [Clostridium botulinum]NFQ39701.1 hypothetical protein [Clostridium botulinum]
MEKLGKKKLGKKKLEIRETIEAYSCSGCSDVLVCKCSNSQGKAYANVNNEVYSEVYTRVYRA